MLEALLAFFFLPIPETGATYDYSGYTSVPATAPIKIDACEASLDIGHGVAAISNLQYGTAFTVTGNRPATRVVIRFAFDDRHFTPVADADAVIEGLFSPGVEIQRTHRYGGGFHEKRSLKGVAAVVCSPQEIDFRDGGIWRAPGYVPLPTATPPPAAAPAGRRQSNPATRPAPVPDTD